MIFINPYTSTENSQLQYIQAYLNNFLLKNSPYVDLENRRMRTISRPETGSRTQMKTRPSMDMRFTLQSTKKFRRSCEQIIQLTRDLKGLEIRYARAKQTNNKGFRYSLRLRLAVMEGVLNTYYDHASWMATQMEKLNQEVNGTTRSDEMVSSSDEDEDENLI